MTTHTPGPWDFTKAGFIYADEFGIQIAETTDSESTQEAFDANVRLIAAAPDLLVACRGALALLKKQDRGGIVEGVMIGSLENALKKVEATDDRR